MNDEKIFEPLNVEEGYRKDGSFFAKCSVCGDLIHKMRRQSVWMHNLVLQRTYHKNGDILMNQTKEVEYCPVLELKKEEVIAVSNLTDAYKLVIEDIAQDIGYVEGAKETALSVLAGRLNELITVWKHEETDSDNPAV